MTPGVFLWETYLFWMKLDKIDNLRNKVKLKCNLGASLLKKLILHFFMRLK